MENYLVRVISSEANVIGRTCVTTNLVAEACRLHGTYPTWSASSVINGIISINHNFSTFSNQCKQ